MINPDQPRSAKLLFSKEELAPDDRSQATRATQKQPKKVKPAQKKAESPRTQPVDRADEHIPAENNKLKRDRSFLRDSDQDVNDQRASNRQLYEKQTNLQPEGQEAPAEDFNYNRFQDEPLDADSGKITRKRPQSSREKPSAQTGKAAKPASGNPRAAPGEVTKEGITKPAPKLSFEENRKKPPSKLKHPSNIVRTVNTELHRKAARANEDNNVAGEASLKAEEKVESSLKMGDHAFHAHKLRA
jgi:hypothetical protein